MANEKSVDVNLLDTKNDLSMTWWKPSLKNCDPPLKRRRHPTESSKRGKKRRKLTKDKRRSQVTSNDRFLALKGRKRKPCRPPGPFADYLRDYWKAKKATNKNYDKSIGEAVRAAAKCWKKLTQLQRNYYRKRYCDKYLQMKNDGTFCSRRFPRNKCKDCKRRRS